MKSTKGFKYRKILSFLLIIISIIGLVFLNISANNYDKTFIEGSTSYTGAEAFYKTYNIEWLFGLLIILIIIGIFVFFLEKFSFYIKRGWRIG